ncbi:aminotransferase class I/II-fold pyridoxal phosphate-dependent enzyme [Dyadobacter tibetensis]|uniref:aminotransferase class I/II-fold pyridoxal phosphate-dependent enzyme n=1 Tax=Dyadobacter tibetensis TaxID=1211851 RepID=UPI000470D95B|nr:aminotransferase class I/II-fold pyridoxal phosphate-dependent enzyme [Dyadobacter tibetensis]
MKKPFTPFPKIWLSPPHLSGSEITFVEEALDGNWVSPAGPHLDSFEQDLAIYLNIPHAVALASGTAALHLALAILGIKRGDFVCCQSLTFVASANPILYQGGIPVFVDSETESWNICPDALEAAFKKYARRGKIPKAVIVVHLFGMPANLGALLPLCQHYGVALIEDAAEALGSIYFGQSLGTAGDMGIISFNGNKIITTSAGGALLTKDKFNAEKARFLSTQAKEESPYYQHREVGYNYRMSNICAGIGRSQLLVLSERVRARRAIFHFYQTHLASFTEISFQPEASASRSNRWLTALLLDPVLGKKNWPEQIRARMEGQGIETRRVWKPMHLQPLFRDAPYIGGTVSQGLFERGLCLPSGSALTEDQLLRIVDELRLVLS